MDENTMTAHKRLEAQLIDRAMKDDAFREDLKRDPKGVFAREFGITMPEHLTINVLEEGPTTVYLVLPPSPASRGGELADADLETIAGAGPPRTVYCTGSTCLTCWQEVGEDIGC